MRPNLLDGLIVIRVEPGTYVHRIDGTLDMVEDGMAVFNERRMYLTEYTFNKIRLGSDLWTPSYEHGQRGKRTGAPPPPPTPIVPRRCAFPGWKSELKAHNRAGVCKHHQHKPGICQCSACARRLAGKAKRA